MASLYSRGSREKLRAMSAQGGPRMMSGRVQPGSLGTVVAYEPERPQSQPFRREVSGRQIERGSPSAKMMLNEFELEQLEKTSRAATPAVGTRAATPAAGSTVGNLSPSRAPSRASTSRAPSRASTSASALPPSASQPSLLGNFVAALAQRRYTDAAGLDLFTAGTPLLRFEEMQASAIVRATGGHSGSQFSLADASGLRISKRRPPTAGPHWRDPAADAVNGANGSPQHKSGGSALGATVPSNRSEAVRLNALLDSLLLEGRGWEQECEAHDAAFAEAALQVASHCAERGELLNRIRKFNKLVLRSEREARDAAKNAREEANEAIERATAGDERVKKAELELRVANQKLDALRTGMVRLKMLRAIHGRKLSASETARGELQREVDRLKAKMEDMAMAAQRERESRKFTVGGLGPSFDRGGGEDGGGGDGGGGGRGGGGGSRRSLVGGGGGGGGRPHACGSDGGAAPPDGGEGRRDRATAWRARRDGFKLRASDQEVNALMSGITTSAARTRTHLQQSSNYAASMEKRAEDIQGQMLGMSSQLGQVQGDAERTAHMLGESQSEQQFIQGDNENMREEIIKLKARSNGRVRRSRSQRAERRALATRNAEEEEEVEAEEAAVVVMAAAAAAEAVAAAARREEEEEMETEMAARMMAMVVVVAAAERRASARRAARSRRVAAATVMTREAARGGGERRAAVEATPTVITVTAAMAVRRMRVLWRVISAALRSRRISAAAVAVVEATTMTTAAVESAEEAAARRLLRGAAPAAAQTAAQKGSAPRMVRSFACASRSRESGSSRRSRERRRCPSGCASSSRER